MQITRLSWIACLAMLSVFEREAAAYASCPAPYALDPCTILCEQVSVGGAGWNNVSCQHLDQGTAVPPHYTYVAAEYRAAGGVTNIVIYGFDSLGQDFCCEPNDWTIPGGATPSTKPVNLYIAGVDDASVHDLIDLHEITTWTRASIAANAGDDVITGTCNAIAEDEIFGGPGLDTISGCDGDDYLQGDEDLDTIYGGEGNDTILGGDDLYTTDVNYLYGDEGLDEMWGSIGTDYMKGGDDADELHGSSGTDWLCGEGQDDSLYGDAGTDYLYGGPSPDDDVTLNGGADNDRCEADSAVSCEIGPPKTSCGW